MSLPFTLRFTGLREGALGREGREGLTCGGPGTVSSITWVQAFKILLRKKQQIEEVDPVEKQTVDLRTRSC